MADPSRVSVDNKTVDQLKDESEAALIHIATAMDNVRDCTCCDCDEGFMNPETNDCVRFGLHTSPDGDKIRPGPEVIFEAHELVASQIEMYIDGFRANPAKRRLLEQFNAYYNQLMNVPAIPMDITDMTQLYTNDTLQEIVRLLSGLYFNGWLDDIEIAFRVLPGSNQIMVDDMVGMKEGSDLGVSISSIFDHAHGSPLLPTLKDKLNWLLGLIIQLLVEVFLVRFCCTKSVVPPVYCDGSKAYGRPSQLLSKAIEEWSEQLLGTGVKLASPRLLYLYTTCRKDTSYAPTLCDLKAYGLIEESIVID